MSDRIEDVNVAEPAFGVQIGKWNVQVHGPELCEGRNCPFHNPSEHRMVDWEMNIRFDNNALVERLCEHGIGHPDPDSVDYFFNKGMEWMGVHGCDGCCFKGESAFVPETQIGELIKDSRQTAVDHGFVDASFGERIALLHSELSEALEEFRNGQDYTDVRIEGGKPEGIPIELADVAIRLFDLCGAYGIDLESAIGMKMAYNATRPNRHGGKKL